MQNVHDIVVAVTQVLGNVEGVARIHRTILRGIFDDQRVMLSETKGTQSGIGPDFCQVLDTRLRETWNDFTDWILQSSGLVRGEKET